MQLTWLHPWLLIGALGASLPVLIHLIGRRRAPVVHFAAFDFLLAVNKRLARRERLRQFLLLLLRTLAILALVAAAARPMPFQSAIHNEVQKRVVIVLDASASMGFVHESESLLEHAKSQVAEIISHLQPGDGVTLVVAGNEIEMPFKAPTVDHSALLRALENVALGTQSADLGSAIEKGISSLEEDGSGVSILVVSDLAANSFEQLRPTTMEPLPELKLIDVLKREKLRSLPNLAINSLNIELSQHSAFERVFQIGVKNYGHQAVHRQVVELVLDGEIKQRGFIDLGPAESGEKSMTVTFDGPGAYRGTIRLATDSTQGFVTDNEVSFVVEVAKGIRVLAVNGDPRMTPYEDELFFVERALEVLPAGESPIELEIVEHEELVSVRVQEHIKTKIDVVILANIRELKPIVVDALESFVEAGGGLLITLGDQISFEKTNEELGGVLPHPIRDFHQAYDPIAESRALGVGDVDWDHPVLRGLGTSFEESIASSETRGYFNLSTGAKGKTRTLLRFDNGAPALLEGVGQRGRVVLLTTTLDLDQSNLVLKSGFPPLLQRLCRYLGGGALEVSGAQVEVGQGIELPLPTGSKSVALLAPDEKREVYPITGDLNRLKVPKLDQVGVYQVEVLNNEWQRMPRLDVAVNPSLLESDFRPIEPTAVAASLGGGNSEAFVSLASGEHSSGDPFAARGFASYFLLALSLFFVSESLLASRG